MLVATDGQFDRLCMDRSRLKVSAADKWLERAWTATSADFSVVPPCDFAARKRSLIRTLRPVRNGPADLFGVLGRAPFHGDRIAAQWLAIHRLTA